MKSIFTFKHKTITALFAMALLMLGQSAMAQSDDFFLTAIGGTKMGGDEGEEKLVDQLGSTKWGQYLRDGDMIVIMKGSESIVPKHYFVVTAADTGLHPERNWRSWYIYAANFASDEEAVNADDSAWTLIDDKQGVGDMQIPGMSGYTVEFDVSENVTTSYKYFKLVINEIQSFDQDTYMQMGEFGFGDPIEIYSFTPVRSNAATNVTDGDEGPWRLVDGFTGKWGYNSEADRWLIFRSSIAFVPYFYTLTTANDTGNYNTRNWRSWEIYGANFDTDDDATAESPAWTLIDQKEDIGSDVLPNANFVEVYFTLSETVTQSYNYFKVNISTPGSEGFTQMSELLIGAQSVFNTKKNNLVKEYSAFNLNVRAYKAYKDAYQDALDKLIATDQASEIAAAVKVMDEAKAQVTKSVSGYNTLESTLGSFQSSYGKLSAAGQKFYDDYVGTNAGPSATYPNGTYQYIVENCPLDDAGITEECQFLSDKLLEYSEDLAGDAIVDVTYEALDGTPGFNTNEGYASLVDGDTGTKWCANNGDHIAQTDYTTWYIVFKASEPIAPTYYRLVTGNDTESSSGRNWLNYRIFAGSFASDDDATVTADGWKLIDDKKDVGTDQIPAANTTACYLYLSQPAEEKYDYFMIIIDNEVSGGLQQMAEFTFYNTGNIIVEREESAEKYALDIDTMYVQPALVDTYKDALKQMQKVSSINDLSKASNALESAYNNLLSCNEAYKAYIETIESIIANSLGDVAEAEPEMVDYFSDAEIAPNELYVNGNYTYIVKHCPLNTSDITKEKDYWDGFVESLLSGKAIVIDGNTAFGSNENHPKLVDDDETTKWAGTMPSDGAFLIFKFLTPQQPALYSLLTGGDTGTYPGRNWDDWKIYGGNFNSNAEATRDAEGWVLLDDRTGMSDVRLPAQSSVLGYFGFNQGITEEYKYFRVEISKAASGSAIQMTEMRFLDEDAFLELREEYVGMAVDFDTYVTAEQDLLDEYDLTAVESIQSAEDFETLYENYQAALNLQKKITNSVNTYQAYQNAVEDIKTYLDENELDASEDLEILEVYLNEDEDESETYPNGTFTHIYDIHELNDSTILAEIDFVRALQNKAVAAGYVAGTDVTSLLVNPSFGKASYAEGTTTYCSFEGWEGTAYTYGASPDGTMPAAENVFQRCDINQTLTGLKNGIYELRINAGYRPCGDILSTNYAARIYANENWNYVQGVIEDMVSVEDAIDGVNCHLTGTADQPIVTIDGDTIGYVIWGVTGSAIAFKAGRYQNSTIVNVTDGTLKIGIQDPGTSKTDNEWLGFGNTTLIYRGELGSDESVEGLDNVLESYVARANTLIEWEAVWDENYTATPNYAQADRNALQSAIDAVETASSASQKYELVEKFIEIFDRIYETKKAYITLFEAQVTVSEKYTAPHSDTDDPTKMHNHYGLLTPDEQDQFNEDMYAIEDYVIDGTVSAEEALKIKADLYDKYPAYLEYNEVTRAQSPRVATTETEAFGYDMVINGALPFVILDGIYEEFAADKTILTFEYKSDADLTNGTFYFDLSNASRALSYDVLPASSEWKKLYFDISGPRTDWGWGKTSSILRWAMTNGTTGNLQMRKMTVITEAQMEAEGGSITTGIETVGCC